MGSYKTLFLVAVLVVLQVWMINVGDGKIIRPSANPNYNDSAAAAANTTQPYTIYQTVTVIVRVNDTATGHQWNATYWPRVDEFSQLELAGTFNNSLSFNPNLIVSVEFQNITITPWKHIYRNASQLMVPYLTAVVVLSKGFVSGFQWQDGCSNCKSGNCLDNSCGTPRLDGSTDICTKTDCNIKVYLAWIGRDASDNACRSIDSTPASFSQYSLTPTVNFGTGLWNDFIYNFHATAPNPLSEAPGAINDSQQ
jgi:hypothetical protein